MRLKLLLFLALIVSPGILIAQQDTVRHLILTEVRLDRADHCYIEITNVGDSALHLANFEIGRIGPWSVPYPTEGDPTYPEQPYANVGVNDRMMLPDSVLGVDESYVIAAFMDYEEEQYARDMANYGYSYDRSERITKREMWALADMQIHRQDTDADPATDSISEKAGLVEVWGGRDTYFILYYIPGGDSVMIDQVNGIFDEANGTRLDGAGHPVAGVTDATNNTILMRKSTVKNGNPEFSTARGEDISESEWLPVPHVSGGNWEVDWRVFWTIGNHDNYKLDETSFTADDFDIDFTDTTMTVPWGVMNDDSIMSFIDYSPGLAWHYDYSRNHEDSAFVSVRTGDVLTMYACGDSLDVMRFTITVTPPADDETRVRPKLVKDDNGYYENGYVPYNVTEAATVDTIWNVPYAARVDSLMKYLELPPGAGYEILWDGIEGGQQRPDLKLGDVLRVTSKDQTATKDYYLKVYKYRESRNAFLTAITWPDIPEYYKDVFGWIGDTIPNFVRTVFEYQVQVPFDVVGIPRLVAQKEDLNSTIEVTRATNLSGSPEDRTVTFTITAENDTTIEDYYVTFYREVLPANVQPWSAEPFISQVVWQDQWANDFLEVCNPGTEDINLSNYMFVIVQTTNPADAIRAWSVDTLWDQRYGKYIPGYKWVDEATWEVTPGRATRDFNTDPYILPGDVWVIGDIQDGGHGQSGFPWWASEQCDILLHTGHNPWGEEVPSWGALQRWTGYHYYLFKIKEEARDSIHNTLKAANDPDDFDLIEHWGDSTNGGDWQVGPETSQPQLQSYVRRPQYYLPTLGWPSDSWEGDTWEECEWIMTNRAYYAGLGHGWPTDILLVTEDIGQHFMYDRTHYRSTVSSTTYLVDEGYQGDLDILGVVDGTDVDGFIANVIKAHEEQTLQLISSSTGGELTGTDVLADGDTLVVMCADTALDNITKYILDVSAEGLSDNATLTAATYTITVDIPSGTGTVSGFNYGTMLETVVDDITVPAGAAFTIVDDNDAWVATKRVNFDTAYVPVMVSDEIFFEVVSQSGDVTILYQLQPASASSDAFVISMFYNVDQDLGLIEFIPMGTNVGTFKDNLIKAPGATWALIDKLGFERTEGVVVSDDRLVVTAEDGVTKKVYYISMLPEEGKKSEYLAFILSDVYLVDQLNLHISKMTDSITNQTLYFNFRQNVTPAEGATVALYDVNGDPKTGGYMAEGDYLVVTAANGVTTASYTIEVELGVSTEDLADDMIQVYPNPSAGKVYISGLEIGNRIQVYSNTGVLVRDVPALQSMETISLEDQSNGIYFILIRNDDTIIGRYNLIKQ